MTADFIQITTVVSVTDPSSYGELSPWAMCSVRCFRSISSNLYVVGSKFSHTVSQMCKEISASYLYLIESSSWFFNGETTLHVRITKLCCLFLLSFNSLLGCVVSLRYLLFLKQSVYNLYVRCQCRMETPDPCGISWVPTGLWPWKAVWTAAWTQEQMGSPWPFKTSWWLTTRNCGPGLLTLLRKSSRVHTWIISGCIPVHVLSLNLCVLTWGLEGTSGNPSCHVQTRQSKTTSPGLTLQSLCQPVILSSPSVRPWCRDENVVLSEILAVWDQELW